MFCYNLLHFPLTLKKKILIILQALIFYGNTQRLSLGMKFTTNGLKEDKNLEKDYKDQKVTRQILLTSGVCKCPALYPLDLHIG